MIDNIFIYTGYFILVINLILYSISFFFKKNGDAFFMTYLFFCTTMQLAAEAMYVIGKENIFLVNIFFVGQVILLTLFYKSQFSLPFKKKLCNVILWGNIGYAILFFSLNPRYIFETNLSIITISSLSIVVLVYAFFYSKLTKDKMYFNFSMGLLIYICSSAVIYLSANITNSWSNEYKFFTWRINAFLIIIYYLLMWYEWKVNFAKKRILEK